jgi:hypothetical protein
MNCNERKSTGIEIDSRCRKIEAQEGPQGGIE